MIECVMLLLRMNEFLHERKTDFFDRFLNMALYILSLLSATQDSRAHSINQTEFFMFDPSVCVK